MDHINNLNNEVLNKQMINLQSESTYLNEITLLEEQLEERVKQQKIDQSMDFSPHDQNVVLKSSTKFPREKSAKIRKS